METINFRDSISELLILTAKQEPSKLAFVCSSTGRSIGFGELDRRVNLLARGLLSLGLIQGDVVAFSGLNRLEMVEIYFALARTGMIGLPLAPRASAREMISIVRATGAKALLHQVEAVSHLEEVKQGCPDLELFVAFGGASPDLDYERLLAASPATPFDTVVNPDDPYYFNMTSGTTGEPKLFMLSHRANLGMTTFIESFDLTLSDEIMTVFPLFGRVGFSWSLISIALGVPNVLADFESGNVLRLIDELRVTIVNMVPTMAAKLLADPSLAERSLDSLRAIIFAGAPLPGAFRLQSERKLCRSTYEFFGMNELGPVAVSRPADRAAKPDSVGKPIAVALVRIADDRRSEVPSGIVGELICKSPMSADGYGDSRRGSLDPFPDGWVATGDLGSLDEDGYLYLKGRRKDVVVTGGHKVAAIEVENILSGAPGVVECAVLGVPDPLWGERVVAVVVVKALSEAPSAERLDAFCRASLSAYKVPKAFRFQEEALPRTPTAKVQKFLLVGKFGPGAPAGSGSENAARG